jgi:Zn-dependent M28 family amino/carboxypeptidase
MKAVTVYGLKESDLGDDVRRVANKDSIEVEDDPEPQRNSFIRSDQYNFIRHGSPALTMKVGYKPGSADDKTFHNWLHERYHAPSDDLKQPVDQSAAGKYEQVISQLMLTVADDSKRPEWKQESFFRRYSEGKSGE